MRFDAEGRKALTLVQERAAGKLAEIHQLLAPGLQAPFSEEELQRIAEGRMAEMPPEDREAFRLKAIVACAELQLLMAEMSRNLADIGEELRKTTQHSQGINAYGKTVRNTGLRPNFCF